MRRFLYILGILTLVVFVVGGVGIGVIAYKGTELDAESKAFVDNAVPAIAVGWSSEKLLDLATPELRKRAKPNELTVLFDNLSRLGQLVAYDGARGEAKMSYFTGSGGAVSGFYVAKAHFQNGSAAFDLSLIKRDGHWMIDSFHADFALGSRPEQRT